MVVLLSGRLPSVMVKSKDAVDVGACSIHNKYERDELSDLVVFSLTER